MKKNPKNDSLDQNAEAHIPPLLESIGNLEIEKFDLTTAEGALEAIPMFDEMLRKLDLYKRSAAGIKNVLEQKKVKTS